MNAKHSSEHADHYTPLDVVEAARATMGGIDLDPASCVTANENIRAKKIFSIDDSLRSGSVYLPWTNGFLEPWGSERSKRKVRVFLNPPGGLADQHGLAVHKRKGGREACTVTGSCGQEAGHTHVDVGSSATKWWFKAMRELDAGRIGELIYIGFSVEILQTTQAQSSAMRLRTPLDFPICFPRARMRFLTFAAGEFKPGASPTHSNFVAYVGPNSKRFKTQFSQFGKVILP